MEIKYSEFMAWLRHEAEQAAAASAKIQDAAQDAWAQGRAQAFGVVRERLGNFVIPYAAQAEPTSDPVSSPAHYTHGGIETIDFIRAKLTPEEFAGYCKGNVIKYISRAPLKGGVEDLRKGLRYYEWMVK